MIESRKIDKKADRLMDKLQSLRIKASDGQLSPESRRSNAAKMAKFAKEYLPVMYAMRKDIANSDDPGHGYIFDGYIKRLKAAARLKTRRHRKPVSRKVRHSVTSRFRLVKR
jgi:hypothetical protein